MASVGEKLITQADVDLSLGRTASGRSDLPDVPEPVMMASVEIIAQRHQALESLKGNGKRVSDATIDKWLVENSPPELKLTPSQALNARAEAAQIEPANYREFLAFRLSWQAYLQTALTEKNIEKHFNNQKSRFDGTRFEVEHVWIPATPGASPARTASRKKLSELRLKILADQLTMAEAGQSVLEADADAKAMERAKKEMGRSGSLAAVRSCRASLTKCSKTPIGKISETV